MIVYFKGVKQKYVLVFDIEFDTKNSCPQLVQFGGLLFQRVPNSDDLYQICRSVNQYINVPISYLFSKYTGISQKFLMQHGITLDQLQEKVVGEFLKDIDLDDLIITSHGVKGDLDILDLNGINLKVNPLNSKPIRYWCTFFNAKRILGRNENLKLADICQECGYFNSLEHNAYSDAWATTAVLSYLRGRD